MKIIVVVRAGAVQRVLCDDPAGVSVDLLDYDNMAQADGAELEELERLEREAGGEKFSTVW